MNRSRKQSSTAYPMNFFMADSADHIAGKTGLTPTVTISKNGAAFAAPSGAVTEIGNGWYSLAGNATDRNTLGELLLHAEAEGADLTDEKYTIESHDPFSLAEPGAKMDLIDAPNATAVTAIQNGLALDSTVMKSAGYTAPPSASDIASAVWSAVTRTLTAFSDSSGITTLLSRIGAALSITGGKVDINDKTGFALADGQAMTAAKVVIDNQNNTIKLYNVDDELIVTYTKTTDGSVHTLSRS